MADADFNNQWKPNGRPQSTMAKSFSLALDDLFKIDSSIADLDAAVDHKKKVVDTHTTELQALEARLKATEERLKLAAENPSRSVSGRISPRPRSALNDTFSAPQHAPPPPPPHTHQESQMDHSSTLERPPTAGNKAKTASSHPNEDTYRVPPLPGALPPTPGTSEDGDGSMADGSERTEDYTPRV